MRSEDDKERRGIQSIEVGGQLLLALAGAAAPLSLKDLAEAAGMAPAKAHPYLVSFGKLGLVAQDAVSGHYGLGSQALRIGLASLRQLNPVRLGMAAALALEQRIHHTVALAVWGNAGPTVVHLEESSHPIHLNLRAGTVMSLSTATGMVCAAYLPPKLVERFIQESFHPHAFAHLVGERRSWKSMQPLLREVRAHGLGRVVGTPIPGVSALAAPVFDHEGHLAMVMTTIGPTGGFDTGWNSANAHALRAAAAEVSAALGFVDDRTGRKRL